MENLNSVVYDFDLLLKIRLQQHSAVCQNDYLVIVRYLEESYVGHDLSNLESCLFIYYLSQQVSSLHAALHQEVALALTDQADSSLCCLNIVVLVVDLDITEVKSVLSADALDLVFLTNEYRCNDAFLERFINSIE